MYKSWVQVAGKDDDSIQVSQEKNDKTHRSSLPILNST